MLIAIPTGVKIFNWLGTVVRRRGAAHHADAVRAWASSRCSPSAGCRACSHSIVPADTQQTDTYYVVAHFHYVLFGGLVFGIFGGFYYWWPKVFGRMLDERLGKWNFWLMLIGFNLTFFPMHILGLIGHAAPHLPVPAGHGLGRPEPAWPRSARSSSPSRCWCSW